MKNFVYKDKRGLWITLHRLESKQRGGPRIVLLPMSHVADRIFYEEMDWEKWCADVVLFEGAQHSIARRMSSAMRFASSGSRLKALFQADFKRQADCEPNNSFDREDTVWHRPHTGAARERSFNYNVFDEDSSPFIRRVRWIWADMDEKEANESVGKIHWLSGVLLSAVIALVGSLIFLFMSRGMLIETLGEPEDPEFSKRNSLLSRLENYISNDRDEYLLDVLQREIENPKNVNKTIAVEYGAAHMKRLHEQLSEKFDYSTRSKRNILVLAAPPKQTNLSHVHCFDIAEERYTKMMHELYEKSENEKSAADGESEQEVDLSDYVLEFGHYSKTDVNVSLDCPDFLKAS